MICGMTYYQILWYFLIYSFAGWVIEVIFHAVTLGKVINRGFLNGPVCPVYGFGVLAVFALVNLIQSGNAEDMNGIWLFVFGVVMATAVELIAGWLLDVLFHARWWDYSDKPLNFHGYICLEFSLIWGLAIVFVVRVFHSFVETGAVGKVPERFGWPLLVFFYAAYAADLIVTVATVRGLNQKLKQLDAVRSDMRIVSDRLSRTVGEGSILAAREVGEGRVQAALAKAQLKDAAAEKKKEAAQNLRSFKEETLAGIREKKQETAHGLAGAGAETVRELKEKKEALQKRFDELSAGITKSSVFGPGRLLRAFPDMKHKNYPEMIRVLQEKAGNLSTRGRKTNSEKKME